MFLTRKYHVINFLHSMGMNSVWNILPVYLLEIVKTNFLVGVITSIYSLTRGFGFRIGRLGDMIGKDRTLALFSLLLVPLVLGLALTRNVFAIVVLLSLVGVLMTALYPSIGAGAAEGKEKGSAFSKIEVSYQVGLIVGPLVGGVLAFYSMSYAFAFWALCALAAFFVARNGRRPEARLNHKFSSLAKTKEYLSLLMGTGALVGFIDAARSLTVPLRLNELGYSKLDIGIVFALSSVATIILLPRFGAHSDKHGRGISSVIGFGLVTVSCILLVFASSLAMVAASMVLMVLGRNIGLFNGRAYLSERENSVSILGLHDSFFTAGRTAGLFALGFLADYFPMRYVFLLPAVFGLFGILSMRGR